VADVALTGAAESEMTGMKVSSSKYEVVVVNWKRLKCNLHVRDESLPQAEEFKYPEILFPSDGQMIEASSAVMRALLQSTVGKNVLSQNLKLFIYWFIFVPIPTYSHEIWVVTEGYRRVS